MTVVLAAGPSGPAYVRAAAVAADSAVASGAPLGALHDRVAPGVVVLTVTEAPGTARRTSSAPPRPIWTATLITASGLAITSLQAVASAIEGKSTLAMVLGTHGTLAARNLAAALPVRVVAVCEALDLALIEARPAAPVFLPHLPIARGSLSPAATTAGPAGEALLAVHHDARAGLWAGRTVVVPDPGSAASLERGLVERALPLGTDARGLTPGAPLFDALGRLAAMVVSPDRAAGETAPPAMVRAETLLRFVRAARGPELRFAGVPPFRRPTLGIDLPLVEVHLKRGKREQVALASATPVAATGAPAGDAPLDLPKIAAKGALERFRATPSSTPARGGGGPSAPTPTPSDDARAPLHATGSASGASSAVPDVTLAMLEAVATPAAIGRSEMRGDWEPRGRADASIGITVLGDYHSPATRDADAFLRKLTDPDATPTSGPSVRLWWQDADRGFGDDYLLAARAARAAGEQGAFWPMHDLVIAEPGPLDRPRVRALARQLDLDDSAFDAALTSEGLGAAVETSNAEGAAAGVLATPSFVVDGRIVEGGSVAVVVLASAIGDAAHGAPGIPTLPAIPPRGVVAGASYSDPVTIARTAARNVARTLERDSRSAGPAPGAP